MRSRNRVITCKRGNMEISFGEKPYSPYFLTNADGLYSTEVDVNVSENAFDDGGIYQSSRIKKRNIVLTIQDRGTDDHIAVRDALLNLFLPKLKGQLTIKENDEDTGSEKVIDYYTEKVVSDGKNSSRTFTISLICPDPYFYDLYDKYVQMANYAAMFTFQHNFISAGEEFGSRSKTKSRNIQNNTGADAVGLTIDFAINGAVTNPSVTRVESGETIRIGTDAMPLSLVYGDVLTVTTGSGNKHIYLLRSGVRSEINQYLSSDSSFFELHQGDNTIGYDAESGVSNIEVSVSYRMRYTHA
ncbi:phage distal tail protein [Porcincola intestinalis]|uniref:Phage tail family protein n=1 Tax=Porcincola intestinalis TaxID=2606632 RepID=A0A6L5X7P3_9FIRM|nr:phage tail domain-containing protein [Porcincola intestinalis]MSS15597.1 phage tail family protein [Porcincola intestinalis]